MRTRSHRGYLLGVLTVILAFNYIDRVALGILLQSIKVDLSLTDTQLGLLTGIAFALFYSVMGIPIARWADRADRVTIIAATTAVWSVAVALCSLASSFVQLLLIRIGVAVGEAGCVPPAHSLIADKFDRSERPRAVSIYMLGVPLSMLIGFFFAGWFNELFGWRLTFLFLGIPGVVLALLTRVTLRDESRSARLAAVRLPDSASAPAQCQPSLQPTLSEVFKTLWASTAFRHIIIGYAVVAFFGNGIAQWKAAFFIRSYGLQTGELGTWLAVIWGVGGLLGTLLGGELASRYAARNERLQLTVIAGSYCVFGIISAVMYLSPTPYFAFALMAVSAVGINAINGPLFAIIQTLVEDRMRAMSIAILYFFANLIGLGIGPLAAGVLSDIYHTWAGEESLRYALLTLCPGYVWCGLHVWRASRSITRNIEDAEKVL